MSEPPSLSRLQQIAESCLKDWFPLHTVLVNQRPDWLGGLELDFHVTGFTDPSMDFAVEINGHQHRYWLPSMGITLEQHEAQVRRDLKKRSICLQRQFKMWTVFADVKGLKKLSDKLSLWFLRDFIVKTSIQGQWIGHINFIKRAYGGSPRIKLKDGILTAKNRNGQRFVIQARPEQSPRSGVNEPVRTTSDNPVPCNAQG